MTIDDTDIGGPWLMDVSKAPPFTSDRSLTVAQLMTALSAMPSDAKVVTEGCDCYGDVTEVQADAGTGHVVLCR